MSCTQSTSQTKPSSSDAYPTSSARKPLNYLLFCCSYSCSNTSTATNRFFGFYYQATDESLKRGIELLGPVLAERMRLDDESDGKWPGRPVSVGNRRVSLQFLNPIP